MGKQGVNLQDSRYGFRAAILSVTRIFARRAMSQGIAKNPRIHDIHRKRSIVTFYFFVLNSKNRECVTSCDQESIHFLYLFCWVIVGPVALCRGSKRIAWLCTDWYFSSDSRNLHQSRLQIFSFYNLCGMYQWRWLGFLLQTKAGKALLGETSWS